MNPKKKIILFSIIFGIVSLILVFVLIWPLVKSIKKDSNEFIETKKEIILSKRKNKELEQLKNFYQKLEPDLEKVWQVFVDPEVPIDLIKFWEEKARDLELSISISPTSPKTTEADFWSSFGFQMSLSGSSNNFLKFLEKIENSFYLIEVQNLSVKKIGEEKVDAILAIKVLTK